MSATNEQLTAALQAIVDFEPSITGKVDTYQQIAVYAREKAWSALGVGKDVFFGVIRHNTSADGTRFLISVLFDAATGDIIQSGGLRSLMTLVEAREYVVIAEPARLTR